MTNSTVYAYLRTSRDSQTLEQQETAIRAAYPPETNIIILSEQLSGWEGKRPEYETLKRWLLQGRIKELCVFSISRLGRNVQEAAALMSLCQQRSVRVRALKENLDFGGPMGFAFFVLFSALAEMDSDLKSAHIRAKFDEKRRRNPSWKMHGSPPDCVARKVKEKAAEVYEMLSQGKTQKHVAKMFSLSEHTITKLVKLEGLPLVTREQYGRLFPDWHLLPSAKMPRLEDNEDYIRQKLAEWGED